MNKKNILKMSILGTIVGILAFSLIPVALAGPPGHFEDRPWWNNLVMPFWFGYWDWTTGEYQYEYWEYSASEDLYFRIGWGAWWEEIENEWFPKWPYEYKLFINDEEIPLQRYSVQVFPKEDREIVAKVSMWYHVFGPGYFTAGGEYLLRWEMWVKRPYQGDGLNYWRPAVDYWGIFSPPGSVWIYEYPLVIVP